MQIKLVGVFGLILVMVGIFGAYMSSKYENVILPNTTVNGVDLSDCTLESFTEVFNKEGGVVSVRIDKEIEEFTKAELGFYIDPIAIEENFKYIIGNQSLLGILKSKDFELDFPTKFDETKAISVLSEWLKEIDPEKEIRDAKVLFDEQSFSYKIVPHEDGSMNHQEVLAFILNSVNEGNLTIELNSQEFRVLAEITSDNESLLKYVNTWNSLLKVNKLDMGGKWYELKPEDFKDWLVIDDAFDISVDTDAVSQLADKLSVTYNTMGNPIEFKNSAGDMIQVPGGDYGWWLNPALTAEVIEELLCNPNEFEAKALWRQEGGPRDDNPVGGSYVEISITGQHLWLYIDGVLEHETQIVTGRPTMPTRRGVFAVTYTTKNARLRGPGYDTKVAYWMPFDGDIGMHDATWQTSFGGERYKQGFGSHGCVNLPLESAKIIYPYVSQGFPVVVY